jgi:hypothetical protein
MYCLWVKNKQKAVSYREKEKTLQSIKIILGSFRFFRKFSGIFASEGAPLVSTTPAETFATGTVGVVDTSGK